MTIAKNAESEPISKPRETIDEEKLNDEEGAQKREIAEKQEAMMNDLESVFEDIKKSESDISSVQRIISLSDSWGVYDNDEVGRELIKDLVDEIKNAKDYSALASSISGGKNPKLNKIASYFTKHFKSEK